MATLISAFRTRVLTSVLGCPDPVVDQAVLDSCIEFCEKSGIVTYTTTPVAVVPPAYQVQFDLPVGTKLVQVQRMWVGSQEIFPAPTDRTDVFSFTDAITGETASTSTPKYFNEVSPGTVNLIDRPLTTVYVTAYLAIKPSRSATSVDDVLYENWIDSIVSGALYRLMRMNASWKDVGRAGDEYKFFLKGIADASLEATNGRTRAEDRVSPVWI